MGKTRKMGELLERMVQYSNSYPSWEKSASLLFLLGALFGCASIFNRSIFVAGNELTDALFLLEVLIPSCLITFSILFGIDRLLGIPVRLSRFFDRTVFLAVLPSATLFALRNTLPAYAMNVSRGSSIRDFVFCTRLLQPSIVFVLEGALTTRRVWRWHVTCLFVLLTGVSLFLFRTFENASVDVPLLGSSSLWWATLLNLLVAVSGAGFFILFSRLATARVEGQPWLPLQDLIAAHFLLALCIQVLMSVVMGTIKAEVGVLLNGSRHMTERLVVSGLLNATMLWLRQLCLAKTSCTLTILVPVYFIIPIRIIMGSSAWDSGSVAGVVLATLGLFGYGYFSLTELNHFGGSNAKWVTTITQTSAAGIVRNIRNAIIAIYGVALFSLLFPLVCKYVFKISTSYVVWSLFLVTLPLALLAHFGVRRHKSVLAMYLCVGVLLFSFMPLQFGPIEGWLEAALFLVEVVVVHVVAKGLDAIQLSNGYRPGFVPFSELSNNVAEELRHDEELDQIVAQFVVGDDDDN